MTTATLDHPPVATATEPRSSALAEHYRRQASSRNVRGDLLEVLGWVMMAVSVALFLADGGAARFTTIAGSFIGVGVIAGLLATTGLLLMLLLAARVNVIDKTLGQPRATALHSKLGDWVVIGLGIHAAFLVTGYALDSGVGILAEFASLWGSTFDFVLAVLGMVLLLAVVVSSIVAARKRLPYEVWHAIHLLSYAAVAVSIPHMFSMGGLFAPGTWQRWYWAGSLIVTGASLLVYRVLLPLLQTADHQLRVSRVVPVGPDTYNIEMTGRKLADLDVRAGQYLHWRFLAPGLWWHQHPFSVSAAPTDDRLRVTVRKLGKGTAALASVKPGTRVAIEGPYGTFSDDARTKESVALVGAGVGIAPIRAILEETGIVPGKATVILRASRPEELYLADEIAQLCHARGARLITLVGHRAPGRWVPATNPDLRLDHLIPNLADTDVFVCGPAGFTAAVVDEARALGVPATQLHDERFDW